jgi:hypothetical protein
MKDIINKLKEKLEYGKSIIPSQYATSDIILTKESAQKIIDFYKSCKWKMVKEVGLPTEYKEYYVVRYFSEINKIWYDIASLEWMEGNKSQILAWMDIPEFKEE